jgi:NADPH-dependent 2,4-dienoyl-CoA reductase/sulfur reductase-like enzyme
MQHHVKYLLVGGGLASASAAEVIRRLDPTGSVLLVGQEVSRPYHRPPLSKEFLRRSKKRGEIVVHPAGWYREHHIELRTGRRATAVDTGRQTVTLDDGQEIAYDRLLLATGASARPLGIPGSDLPNLFTLRTLDDVDRLHHAIDKAKAEGRKHERGRGRIAVIGGGVLGVELSASLTQLGLAVDLIVAQAHPWAKFAGESTGKFLSRYLEARGVTVHTGRPPLRLDGDGRVQRVVFAEGESIPCDFAIAAVGINVNRELLRGTPIRAEKAILTDQRCQTSVEGVWAAGDCAAVFDPLFGKHRVLDHWDNAGVTGTIAGTNMAGGTATYDAVNNFFSDVFELSLNGWGEARFVDHRLVRGNPSPESPDFIEIGIAADGRVAQVLAVNHAGEDETLIELVKRRVEVSGAEEALKDPTRDLRALLR